VVERHKESIVLRNTNREIWRLIEDDYYSPSVFVTDGGGIGMQAGGTVFVMTVEEWIKRAGDFVRPSDEKGAVVASPNQCPRNTRKTAVRASGSSNSYDKRRA